MFPYIKYRKHSAQAINDNDFLNLCAGYTDLPKLMRNTIKTLKHTHLQWDQQKSQVPGGGCTTHHHPAG